MTQYLTPKQKYLIPLLATFIFYPIWAYVIFFVFDKLMWLGILPIIYVSMLGGIFGLEYFRMKDRNWKPDPQKYNADGKKVS